MAVDVPELRARFLREARTAGGLSHPCIVPVLDYGVDGEVQYLVMEFVDSVTLAQHLEPLQPARRVIDPVVLACVRDVAAGRALLTDIGVPGCSPSRA